MTFFSVETEKGNLYFKKPDRNAFALALSYRSQSKTLEAGEVLVENCLVGGDESILDDEYLKIAVSLRIANIIELPEVVVKSCKSLG
ncbi:MAG: hypothetical protein HC803_06055 [Saprospiraceae bacterium]|nr:hypothetical protein [Saprospiraceae bacterium]